MTVLIGVLVAIGMLVVVPLGLRLMDDTDRRLGAISQVWLGAGLAGTLSLLVDGTFAVVLACLYAAVTVWLVGLAVARLRWRRSVAPVEVAVLTAMVSPAVAGVSLIAERGGWDLLGFGPTTLALTVAHFHYAGFGAALIAALTASTSRTRVADAGAVTVPVGIGIVFLGYFTNDVVELVGTVVLAVGLAFVAWAMWSRVRPQSSDATTRLLFTVSPIALVVTLLLAVNWAGGQVWDAVPHLSLTAMAATHGVLNAVGFAGCGVLAWHRFAVEQARVSVTP